MHEEIISKTHFAKEEIFTTITTEEEEMLQNETVAVGDICNNSFSIAQIISLK